MQYPAPEYSRSEVRRVGSRFREGIATDEDLSILENWRASHSRLINVFQANLRKRCAPIGYPVGQRLKRRPTIIDKLAREPGMDLARMNDIAGCRVILPSLKELYEFRDGLLEAKWRHKLIHEPDKYDYLISPKETGYRGIHHVYKFVSRGVRAELWNGLRIEIQLRTYAQHVWATGVETGDLLTMGRAKFGDGDGDYKRYWLLASEIIARTREGQPAALSELNSEELAEEFLHLDNQLNIRRLFRSARRSRPQLEANRTTVLIYRNDLKRPLSAYSFSKWEQAIKFYNYKESQLGEKADVVLVEANNVRNLRKVFQNYFSNTTDFLRYINTGVELLGK